MSRRSSKLVLWICSTVLVVGLVGLVAVFVVANRPRRSRSVADARREIAMRRFHRAAGMLSEILEAEPESVSALVARGGCYVHIQRYDKARADFERALALKPAHPAADLGLALVLAGERKHDDALAAAQKIAQANPALLKAYATVGKIHYQIFELAAGECVRICEEDDENRQALAAAAEVRLGRFESVEAYWRQWHDRQPGVATRSGLRAHLDRAKEQLGLALQNLKIGAGLADGHPGEGDIDTLLELAAAQLGIGAIDEAERTSKAMTALGRAGAVHGAIARAEVLGERANRLTARAAKENDPKLAKLADEAGREAISLLEDVLKKHPYTAPVRDKLVALYVRAGMFDKADRWLRRNRGQPLSVNARYVRGIVLLAKGDHDAAIAAFTEISDKMRGDPGFHFSFGMAYYRGGAATASFARAADEFRKVVALRPNFVPARFRLAKLFLREGWYGEAREQCEKILAIPGRSRTINAQVYLMLSEASRGLKDYGRVYEALDAAYGEVPSESTLMKQYIFMIGQDRHDEVLQNIEALVAKANDTPTYACIRGYAYLKKGMPKEAVESFRKALILDPQYIMGYVHLAGAYEALRQYPQAVKEYKAAIQMVKDLELPDNPDLYYRLGVSLLKQTGDLKGEEELKRAIEIDSRHVPARLRLAALELGRGNFKEALKQAKIVTRQAAKAPEARFLVGLVYSASARRPDDEIRAEIVERREKQPRWRGKEPTDAEVKSERRLYWGLAVENYEKAMELDPRFSHSYEVGIVYAMQSEFDKMASVYTRALKVAPPRARPRLLRRLATAHLCAGDHDKAVEVAERAIKATLALPKPNPNEELRNRFALTNCLIVQGDFARARVEVNRMKGGLPGFPEVTLRMVDRLARLRADMGDKPERQAVALNVVVGRRLNLGLVLSRAGVVWLPYAEDVYRTLLRNDRDNVIALYLLGDLYLVTSRSVKTDDPLKKAEAANRRILGLAPTFAPAFRNLAVIEDTRTRAAAAAEETPEKRLAAQARAVTLYQAAIRNAPGFWIAKLELAAIYQRAGANDKAMRLYEEVIAVKPGEIRALNDYANLCVEESKNLDKAVEYAKRAKKLSPFSGAISDTLGVLHTILGNTAEAVEQLEQARSLLPNHPHVLYHLAVAYVKGKKTPEAIAVLEDLLKKNPQDKRARALLKKLKAQ